VTFSISAFDAETGELGIAVQSKFLAVGAVMPFAKARSPQSWAHKLLLSVVVAGWR
jgi:uncharacterized Ntn-hydrolase superfamily protein